MLLTFLVHKVYTSVADCLGLNEKLASFYKLEGLGFQRFKQF